MRVVEVKELTFGYKAEERVLDHVDFEVGEQELFAVVGASGSGKSTLLRLIAGIISGDDGFQSGTLEVFGGSPDMARCSGKFGYVFQDFKILPFLSVRENLEWAIKKKRLHCGDSKDINDSVADLLGMVGLPGVGHLYPHHLSGGMTARVAIARALCGSPKLVL